MSVLTMDKAKLPQQQQQQQQQQKQQQQQQQKQQQPQLYEPSGGETDDEEDDAEDTEQVDNQVRNAVYDIFGEVMRTSKNPELIEMMQRNSTIARRGSVTPPVDDVTAPGKRPSDKEKDKTGQIAVDKKTKTEKEQGKEGKK